jgi:TetR/AcrR family transcriptional repressor of nem operon
MGRPREFDETQVLREAQSQFRHKGYAGTSVADLTEATRLGKGSLYGAFGDKHQLFLRVLDDYSEGSVVAVRDALSGDGLAIDRLRSYLLAMADGSARDPDGCLLANSTAELAGQDEEVAAKVGATFAALGALIEAAVREAQAEGDIDPDADARAVGGMLLAVARGMEALGKGGASRRSLRRTAEQTLAVLASRER